MSAVHKERNSEGVDRKGTTRQDAKRKVHGASPSGGVDEVFIDKDTHTSARSMKGKVGRIGQVRGEGGARV